MSLPDKLKINTNNDFIGSSGSSGEGGETGDGYDSQDPSMIQADGWEALADASVVEYAEPEPSVWEEVEVKEKADEKFVGPFKVTKFDEKTGSQDGRMMRKWLVAMSEGPEAFREEDYYFGKSTEELSPEAKKATREVYREIKNSTEEEFYAREKELLENIETPFGRDGAEGVYDSLKKNKEALKLIFSRVPEAWQDMPEAEGEPDEEGQKRITLVALKAFMEKYPTAVDSRKAEDEFTEEVLSGESAEDFKEHEEKVYEEIDEMNEILYGAQESYLRTAEDVRRTLKDREKAALEGRKEAKEPVVEEVEEEAEKVEVVSGDEPRYPRAEYVGRVVANKTMAKQNVEPASVGRRAEAEEEAETEVGFDLREVEEMSEEETKEFKEKYGNQDVLGSYWTSPVNGMNYGLTTDLLLGGALAPELSGKMKWGGHEQKCALSKAFELGNGLVGFMVYIETEEEEK